MSVRDVAAQQQRPLAGLAFALGLVVRAGPELVALDTLITLAEALAPLAMLQGTRLLLDALGAGHPPWPGLALLAVGEAVPAFGSRVTFGPVGEAMTRRIESALRPRVLATLATMRWSRLEDPASQDRLDRVEDGVAVVDIAWDSGGALLRDIGRGLSALAFLLTVSPWAALFAAAGLGPEMLLRRAAAVEWEGVRLSQIPAQRQAGYLFGLLTGPATAAEVRLFGYAGYVRERWLAAFRRVQQAELAEQARTAPRAHLAVLAGTALLAAAAALVLLRHGGAGTTTSGVLALAAAFRQTQDLSYWVGSLAQEGFNAANLREVLEWGRDLPAWRRPGRLHRGQRLRQQPPAPRPGPVAALRDVPFTYPGGSAPAVRDLTLEVRPGERLALVGRNGSSKSTAVKLLLGFLAPDSGEATPPVRAGVAFQEFARYSLTAGESVGPGRPSQMHARGRVASCLRQVGLDLAPDQPVGPPLRGGLVPSGGQWQRLALARALRSEAPLLVLDEPTAALDPLAEARLYADFARLAARRTVVLVTHRLAAARLADRIAVFDGGRIVQSGTHQALLADTEGLSAHVGSAKRVGPVTLAGLLWRAVRYRPLALMLDFALAVAQGGLGGAAVAAFGHLVDRRALAALLLWSGAVLAGGFCVRARPLLSRRAQQGIREALGGELVDAAVRLPYEDFARRDVRIRLDRASGVLQGDRVYHLLQIALTILTEGSRTAAVAAFRTRLSAGLAVPVAAAVTVQVWADIVRVRPRFDLDLHTRPHQHFVDSLGGLLRDRAANAEARVYRSARWLIARWRRLSLGIQGAQSVLAFREMRRDALVRGSAFAVYLGAFVYGVVLARQGAVTAGGVVALAAGVRAVQEAAEEISHQVADAQGHGLHLLDALAVLRRAQGRPAGLLPLRTREVLTLRDIRYRYPDARRDALRGVTLRLRRGRLLALVGENGPGKSSTIKIS